ncbi:unnamed protein product [Trypanosoma congolense IL3000]|uniref:WGS project CAEQ00000000 data, annotated contig 1121 n=1 Tax=Trypanosoma congolense (strain IL3000) TaxID=1068625 RepID=F9W3X0_TRYCI|nr:unnamed protein product [Trypanosoma congolense IL3000]CCD14566.1 unnamed protein product [Trypanosoma congolense IL3000]
MFIFSHNKQFVKKKIMSVSCVISLALPSIRTLTDSIKYLTVQEDGVRIDLRGDERYAEVRLTCVGILQRSYLEVVLRNGVTEKRLEIGYGNDVHKEGFPIVVHGLLLSRVLRLFNGYEPVMLELGSDLTSVFLHTVDRERWARLGVHHDLGPLLTVAHDISVFHNIPSIPDFCHSVQVAGSSHGNMCSVVLAFDDMHCFIEFSAKDVKASVRIDGSRLQHRYEGQVGVLELSAFGEFVSRANDCATLSVGFGSSGLAAFQLKWNQPPSSRAESIAYLYFCTA